MDEEAGEPAGQKRSLSEDLEPEAKKAKTDEQKAQEQEAQQHQEAAEKEAYLKLLAGQDAQLTPELQEALWQTHRVQLLAAQADAKQAKAATAKLQETLQGKIRGLTVQIAQLSKGGPAAGPRSG